MTSTPALVLGTLLGIATGIGGYTFIYARGGSYLTNDPAACVNCHVMREQFDGWVAGSHRAVAVCNDCHTPPGHLAKYTTKALNGFWHSFAFTSGRFPDPITITARNRRVTEQACRKCHSAITEAIESPVHGLEETACLRCHADVGHR
jgi:cytochrome c nitrite reductase small subunit